jgi:hypothetical protein
MNPRSQLTFAPQREGRRSVVDYLAGPKYRPPSEDIPMTFQVGLVGTDGVLIASDMRASGSGRYRTSETVSKLNWNSDSGIACAVTGDKSSVHAALEICSSAIPENATVPDVYDELQRAVTSSWEKYRATMPEKMRIDNPRADSRLIIATPKRSHGHLWQIDADRQWSSTGPCRDKAFQGDVENAAVYFLERFYRTPRLLPVRDLALFAAHIVLEAGALNPTGVGGLEMLTWQFGEAEPRICTETDIAELTRRSKDITTLFGSRIFGVPLH